MSSLLSAVPEYVASQLISAALKKTVMLHVGINIEDGLGSPELLVRKIDVERKVANQLTDCHPPKRIEASGR